MNSKLIKQIKPNFTNPTDFSVSIYNEHKQYNLKLHQLSIFPYANINTTASLAKAVASFRFRSIEFSKKRALPFFLAMELLTHRKCVASLSQRNIQAWKIRKGRLVGCKVTLRRQGLNDFLDTLTLTFPRMEKFQPTRNFLGKATKKVMTFPRKYSPTYSLSLGELVLFYPIELGLGLHQDVQRFELKFIFKSLSLEEHFFILRYFKIPVL